MNYKRSKYFTTSSGRKIKYLLINKKSQITVVFFHGFMSDMLGKKPLAIERFCKKHSINFLKFEYSGHGKSEGNFIDGNISKWTNESRQLIKSKIKSNKKLIFIGSSMGSWIAINLIKFFQKQVKGYIGISSAPEFLEELMWKNFNNKAKKTIIDNKIYYLKNGNFTYPITKQLIFDGRKNKVLNNKINLLLYVILLHGQKDEVVPLRFSKKLLKIFTKSYTKFIIIKNGNHSLSKKNDLKKICRELDYVVSNIP